MIANHLGRRIPGNPQVIVRNMAGAGGIVATNLFGAAAKDGTVVGGVQNNALDIRIRAGPLLLSMPTSRSTSSAAP